MTSSTRARPQDSTDIDESDTTTTVEKEPLIEISVAQVFGGALAAMTAAALGSTLGLGGTIVGAAFASVVAGVAGALYTGSLRKTGQRVRTVFVGRGKAGEPVVVSEVEPAVPVERVRRRFPWKVALVVALSVFALAAVAITSVEALTGRSLSGEAGTTVQQVGGGSQADPERADPPAALESPEPVGPTASPTPTPAPTADPGTAEPSGSADPVTPSAPVETESGSPSPLPSPDQVEPSAPSS